MKAKVVVLPGDGIGPEVTTEAVNVMAKVGEVFGHRFTFEEHAMGGCAIDAFGAALPKHTEEACLESDAVLLGAIGGPKWDDPSATERPERGLLALRKAMGVFANLRPVTFIPEVADASPLKREVLEGVDLLVVRELTGGIYFGDKGRDAAKAHDVCAYTTKEIERIARKACQLAAGRERKLTSVDKANVLETSRLWRATVERIVRDEYPYIQLEHMLVDAAAMHLMRRPADFDVMVTENMFGDILTDEASMLAGSMGLLASASVGGVGPGLYEPIHGSAPDIAGLGVANPMGAILSAALLMRYSFGLETEAEVVEAAVRAALAEGSVTPDLDPSAQMGTKQVGARIVHHLEQIHEDTAHNALAMNIGAMGSTKYAPRPTA